MLARRQLEHGETLSQRTFRRRQVVQLRDFGLSAEMDAVGAGRAAVNVAFFSEAEPLTAPSGFPLGDLELMGACFVLQILQRYFEIQVSLFWIYKYVRQGPRFSNNCVDSDCFDALHST